MSAGPSVRDALDRTRLLGIVRYRNEGDLIGGVGALVEGGLRVFEITVDTPGALGAISAWSDRAGVCVGAGTVTTVEEVRRVADAGASFVVSPGFDALVVETALELGLGVLPGVATATEVLHARRAGAELYKLFPAGALGPGYLAQLRGPFSREAFVPTGGVGIDDIGTWLRAGSFAVALGSDLAGRAAPAGAADLADLAGRALRAVRAVEQFGREVA